MTSFTVLCLDDRRQVLELREAALGGFRCLRTELDNLSASPPCLFYRCPEARRYVKLNHLGHDYFLHACESRWAGQQ